MKQLLAFLILLASSLMVRADITSNLVAHWKLDETSGTSAADSSGNGHTGTYVNSPTLGETGAWAGGKAVKFASASSQWVTLGSKSATTDITVSLWVKRTDTAANHRFARWGKTIIGVSSTGTIFRWWPDSDLTETSWTISAIGAGVWTHVCVTQTSTSATLYINGASIGTNTTDVIDTAAGASTVAVGTSNPTNGTLDDVRIYSRALASGDVSELYAYTGAKAGIWHYYHQSSLKPCTRFFLPRTKPAETLYALSP